MRWPPDFSSVAHNQGNAAGPASVPCAVLCARARSRSSTRIHYLMHIYSTKPPLGHKSQSILQNQIQRGLHCRLPAHTMIGGKAGLTLIPPLLGSLFFKLREEGFWCIHILDRIGNQLVYRISKKREEEEWGGDWGSDELHPSCNKSTKRKAKKIKIKIQHKTKKEK